MATSPTTDPTVAASYSEDASGLCILPEAVYRPSDGKELRGVLDDARGRGLALTAAGLRSSTVGGPLASRGAVLSLEKMSAIREIDPVRGFAVAGPGIVLADFKEAIRLAGAFYPPDPTSEGECTLGGTVATNASGSRTYRYGTTRDWVRRVRVLLADGTELDLRRRAPKKCTTGFAAFRDPIDLFIGSEGTLGIISEVEIALRPPPPPAFAAFAFFADVAAAVAFVQDVDADIRLAPRCLELFDSTAVDIIRPDSGGISIPGDAEALIFFEEEAEDIDARLPLWLAALGRHTPFADATVVARHPPEQRELRRLRHAIPSTINEWAVAHREAGGRKVSTDFAVPLVHLPRMLEHVEATRRAAGVDLVVVYGHVGDGHPHVFMRGRDAEEVTRLYDVARAICREAVRLGGVVAAEHGIGKVKHPFLDLQYPPSVLRAMRAIKRELDPECMLAPGNIFPDRA